MFQYQSGLQGLQGLPNFSVQPGQGMLGGQMQPGQAPGQNLEGIGGDIGELIKRLMAGGGEGQQMGDIASLAAAEAKMAGGGGGGPAALGGGDFWDILQKVIMASMAGG